MYAPCLHRIVLLAAAMSMVLARRALADFNDLLARVPPGANAVAAIDVRGIVSSPMGVENKWKGKLAHPDASNPLLVPPDATRIVMASWIEPSTVQPMWEASVIELAKAPSMERIAKTQGGFVETVADKQAVWSPMNAYFVRLDTRVLGAVAPADRQFAARWARQSGSSGQELSPYLQSAVNSMGPKTHYLFALDLQDAASAKRVRHRLSMGEFASLAEKNIDIDKISAILASIKGLTLQVAVGEAATGKGVVDFGRPASPLADFGKPLLLEFLGKCGAGIDDFASWNVAVKENALTFEGELSTDGLRRLMSIVDPPSPTQTAESDEEKAAAGEKSGGGAAPESQKAVIAASKAYFDTVTSIIDNIGKQIRTATSMTQGAVYVGRSARRIGRLPILNVDPALVEWGTGVSIRMGEISSVVGVGGLQARARAVGTQDAYVSGTTFNYGEIESDPNDAINRRNVARQRVAATEEQKAKAGQAAMQIISDIEASRAAIRASMTQKYKAAF